MLRRAPNFTVGNWGSTNPGFTLRTGLAELIYLHPFGPFRFADMLLSPPGWSAVLGGAYALDLLPLWGNLTCAEAAHYYIRESNKRSSENTLYNMTVFTREKSRNV
jgi:hypothetical protein